MTGEYLFSPELIATISEENGALIVSYTGLSPMTIHAITETICLVTDKGGDMTTIKFDKDDDGKIAEVTVFMSEGELKATKTR